jgi:hypothetical protein
LIFSYACGVLRARLFVLCGLIIVLSACYGSRALVAQTAARASSPDNSPVVTKVEPPNWWLRLTPELMVLLSGRNLEATGVSCNLADLVVERTQAAAGGDYLFVWLKLGAGLKSGTAVCRIITPTGTVSFELPLAAREQTIHKFQGLTTADSIYLIMPDRFANGEPANDEPAEAPGSHNRAKARAYHGGDLIGIREHLDYLKDLGVTTLWLTPIVKNGATEDYHGYGAVDLYAVEPHLGTLRDYQELVAEAHKQGMKIVFDVVPNHVGPKHPWAAKPPLPDWFHGTVKHHLNSSPPVSGTFYGEPVETQPKGRMVRGPSSGHEYGKSDGRAVLVAERNLVDGGFRIGRFSCGHVSLCVTRILGAVARGTAKDLSTFNDHRRSVSPRCERDFLFCGRTEALRRDRYRREHAF